MDWPPGTPPPILETGRVRLRPIVPDDAEDLFEVFGDPLVTRYWSSPAARDVAEMRTRLEAGIARVPTGDLMEWAITEPGSDRALGTCALAEPSREHRRCEVGYALARSAAGRGLARAAVTCIVDHAFDVLRCWRVEADVDPRNEPSIRLLERLGFRREGVLRARWHIHGEIADSLYFAMLADERPARAGR